ncbi:MAG: hypothetical protein AAB652_01085 [Patescibacteria group bacterium]
MSKISAKQCLSLLAKLGENADWDSLTVEQVQVGISEAKRAGSEFTAFVRNGFRMQIGDFFRETDELTLQIPALPRPTLWELQAKFSWIKSIERDTSPIEVTTLALATVLRPDENRINGTEYECRIASKLDLCLGYQQAVWLVEHQDEFPDFMALLGKIYIDFSGLVVVNENGYRFVPCLSQGSTQWYLRWYWLGTHLDRRGRLAISSKPA